jgi:hypothetical protein
MLEDAMKCHGLQPKSTSALYKIWSQPQNPNMAEQQMSGIILASARVKRNYLSLKCHNAYR